MEGTSRGEITDHAEQESTVIDLEPDPLTIRNAQTNHSNNGGHKDPSICDDDDNRAAIIWTQAMKWRKLVIP